MATDTTNEMYGGLFKSTAEFINRNESMKVLAARVYRRSQSTKSVKTYVDHLRPFFAWLGKEPDEAKRGKFDWMGIINEYIDMQVAKKLAPKTILTWFTSIKKWCVLNSIQLDWKAIELPKVWKVEKERLPTKEELRDILNGADLTDKMMVTALISSGMRIGALLKLKLKDVDMGYDCPLIKISPEITKMRQGYITFMSKEAKQILTVYLRERELNGEKITPESFMIGRERPRGLPISISAAEHRWIQLLKRANKATKGREWYLVHVHTLRKFFKSWASLSGIPQDLVEAFMGHRGGISQAYFLPSLEETSNPEIVKRVLAEYEKALPALTIFSEEEKVKALEGRLEETRRQLEEEAKRHEGERHRLEEERRLLEERVRRLEELAAKTEALRRRTLIESAN